MAKIIVCVSNDLTHDQRVRKQCGVLMDLGHEILLVGRLMKGSLNLNRPYASKRFWLPFSKGALFYAALNTRLFFFLLFQRFDGVICNDLDTLLPGYLVSKLRRKDLVYDSHEFFTESAGLTGRPFPTSVWKKVEGWIFPKLQHAYTVNGSFSKKFEESYGKWIPFVRNIPPLRQAQASLSKTALGLPEKPLVLLQGAYLDIDRGAIELAAASLLLNNALVLIVGAGAEWEIVHAMSKEAQYKDKLLVLPKLAYEELAKYTQVADLGISIDKPLHGNYIYSLPNKLFDYIHAGLPVLISDLVELKKIVNDYGVGRVVSKVDPKIIATTIEEMLAEGKGKYQPALKKATQELNWESEQLVLKKILSEAFG